MGRKRSGAVRRGDRNRKAERTMTLAKSPKARSCPSPALLSSLIFPSWASGPTFFKKNSSHTGVLAELWSRQAGEPTSFLPPSTRRPFPASFLGRQRAAQPAARQGSSDEQEERGPLFGEVLGTLAPMEYPASVS